MISRCMANGDGKLVPSVMHHVMMLFGEMQVELLLFLNSTLDTDEWPLSLVWFRSAIPK